MATEVNYESQRHQEIWDKIKGGAGPNPQESAGDQRMALASSISEIRGLVESGIRVVREAQEGQAANAAVAGISPMMAWADHAQSIAYQVAGRISEQTSAFSHTNNSIPEVVPVSTDGGWKEWPVIDSVTTSDRRPTSPGHRGRAPAARAAACPAAVAPAGLSARRAGASAPAAAAPAVLGRAAGQSRPGVRGPSRNGRRRPGPAAGCSGARRWRRCPWRAGRVRALRSRRRSRSGWRGPGAAAASGRRRQPGHRPRGAADRPGGLTAEAGVSTLEGPVCVPRTPANSPRCCAAAWYVAP